MTDLENHSTPEIGANGRPPSAPSLSVILLSEGTPEQLERALASIEGRCRALAAEVIAVRAELGDAVSELSAAHPGVIFLDAPKGSSSAALRLLGVDFASGDILTLRMDGAVGDGEWLQAFESAVGATPAADRAPRETARKLAPVDERVAAREPRGAIVRPLSVVAAETSGSRDRRESASEREGHAPSLGWSDARRAT